MAKEDAAIPADGNGKERVVITVTKDDLDKTVFYVEPGSKTVFELNYDAFDVSL